MGINNCGKKPNSAINVKPEYYFTKKDPDINTNNNNGLQETVKLEVKIIDTSSGSGKVRLVLYEDSKRTTTLKGGDETEESYYNAEDNAITFKKFFIVNYYFEKEQPIDFIISGKINGKVSTTLPSIMGSRGQTLRKEIEGTGAKLEVRGFGYKKKQTATLNFNVSLKGTFNERGLVYNIKHLGNSRDPKNTSLYKSETLNPKLNLNLTFNTAQIPDIYLAPDLDYQTNIMEFELIDPYLRTTLLDKKEPLSSFIGGKNNLFEIGPGKSIEVVVNEIKDYAFLDYIRGGMQINLAVAIDFTGSNGNPRQTNSLHYLGPNLNSYEIAIQSCGNIVAYYDYDQLFPAYGFGGKFFLQHEVNHCYPLNNNPDNPNIQGIDGILETYRDVLGKTTLYGPTYFHYVLNKVINDVKEDVMAENMNYTILMILTDGIIDDMDDTIDSLVEASYLPISVIIIGIGDADFRNMNVLDADDEPLISRNGRKADRDLVQFVPFRDFSYNGEKLAQEVLAEVPRQVIEYYQHKKIPPKDPIFNIP